MFEVTAYIPSPCAFYSVLQFPPRKQGAFRFLDKHISHFLLLNAILKKARAENYGVKLNLFWKVEWGHLGDTVGCCHFAPFRPDFKPQSNK